MGRDKSDRCWIGDGITIVYISMVWLSGRPRQGTRVPEKVGLSPVRGHLLDKNQQKEQQSSDTCRF